MEPAEGKHSTPKQSKNNEPEAENEGSSTPEITPDLVNSLTKATKGAFHTSFFVFLLC